MKYMTFCSEVFVLEYNGAAAPRCLECGDL